MTDDDNNQYTDIFHSLIQHKESEVVEFKKAERNLDFDDLGEYFSALSNGEMLYLTISKMCFQFIRHENNNFDLLADYWLKWTVKTLYVVTD